MSLCCCFFALALYLGIAVIHWWWPFAVDLFHASELFILANILVGSPATRWWCEALWRWLQQQCKTFSILICLNHAQIHTHTHTSFYAWKVGKRKKVWEMRKRARARERGMAQKECNRFNVLIKIPQQSCCYLYLFDFLFCHVAFDSVLCAYWVTPMCHARRPNAAPSQRT